MTHLTDFFQLPRFPPSVGENFSGKQTTKPMLQSLDFPTVFSLGALTLTIYSGRLCQDSHHSTATKPPSPVCLHPHCFPSSSPLLLFQDSHISRHCSSLLPPPAPCCLFFPPFSQQQPPLSPCQPGASASVQLLTEVTGVTYNYMVTDYRALFNNQIFAFLQVAEYK